MTDDLLSTGAFARRTRLSRKALRLYDELGLVPPARVDPRTGYRWYRADQVDSARLVALLRRLDMPLARIARVLALPPAEAADDIGAYWAAAETVGEERRALVAHLRDLLEGKITPMIEIKVRDVPARTLLTVTRHAGADTLGRYLGEALGRFRALPPAPVDWPHNCPFVVYYGEVSADGDGPVELCRPTADQPDSAGRGDGAGRGDEAGRGDGAGRGDATANERDPETGGVPGASVRVEGAHREAFARLTRAQANYPRILAVHRAFEAWLADGGHTATAPPRQIFVADWRTVGADDVACDIAVPLRPVPTAGDPTAGGATG